MKLDLDKEVVECVAIAAASVVVVAAMVFDGSVGDAVGTALLTGSTAFVSYYAGQKRSGTTQEAIVDGGNHV